MFEDFVCGNCGVEVHYTDAMGTAHRNHCPGCLHSLHVDREVSGDRAAACGALMHPVGLTFKKVKPDKYGKARQGDLMLVHVCDGCGRVSINRIARDDREDRILGLLGMPVAAEVGERLDAEGIVLLDEGQREVVLRGLFGHTAAATL